MDKNLKKSVTFNLSDDDITVADKRNEKYERLEGFIRQFVKIFEKKLQEYKEEGGVNGATKKGGLSDQVASTVGKSLMAGTRLVTGTQAVSLIAGGTGKMAVNFLFKKFSDHRGKAKRVAAVFKELKKEQFRELLVRVAGEIFWCFQNQFIVAIDDDSWEHAIEKLAIDAVDRAINYINDEEKKRKKIQKKNKKKNRNIGKNKETNHNFITKGVIFGKSKISSISQIFHSGLSIENEEGNHWNTYEFYQDIEIVIMKINNEGIQKYYTRNVHSKIGEKYGYRYKFEWEIYELIESDSEPLLEYEFCLKSDDNIVIQLKNILDKINMDDPEQTAKRMENKLNIIADQINNIQLIKENKRKPIWFDMKPPIKSFTGRVNELEKLHISLESTKGKIAQIVLIVGLGGIGKSELARKYAFDYRQSYGGNIIWINAITQESLNESFTSLAKELNIQIRENMDLKSISREIYKILEHRNILFIFDYAEKLSDIKDFLLLSSSPDIEKPYFLITSRNQNWNLFDEDNLEIIKLDEFTIDESIEFLKKSLLETNIEENSTDDDFKELAEELQYFPLALGQAAACIKQINKQLNSIGNEIFDVSDYLKEFQVKTKKSELLKCKANYGTERYIGTVFTTWNVTLNKIKDNIDALEIIQIMAYLSSNTININYVFLNLVNDDSVRLGKAVGLLDQYSMINLKKGKSNINRLVQEVIRLKLQEEEGKEIKVLRKCFHLLGPLLRKFSLNEIDDCHINSIWNYASDYEELIEEFYFKYKYYQEKYTPLHLLAKCGDIDTIQKILNYFYNNTNRKFTNIINAQNRIRETPLYIASKNGHIAVIKILKDLGANIDRQTSLIAAFFGHTETVQYLNFDDVDCTLLLAKIFNALRNQKFNELKILLESLTEEQLNNAIEPKFGDVNYPFTQNQWTPLYYATYWGYLDIVKLFINNKANVNCSAQYGYSALHQAASKGHLEILKLLIENGADTNAVNINGKTILHAAALSGQAEIFKYLINNNIIDVNHSDNAGLTPLHAAAFYNRINIIEILLEPEIKKKLNLNKTDVHGTTPVFVAMMNCNTKIVDLLLEENGVNIYCTITGNCHGIRTINTSVLHMAIAYDEVKVVIKLFEQEGINIINQKIQNNENYNLTAIHLAAYYNSVKVIKYFIKKGIKMDENFNKIKEITKRKPIRTDPPAFYNISFGIYMLCINDIDLISIILKHKENHESNE